MWFYCGILGELFALNWKADVQYIGPCLLCKGKQYFLCIQLNLSSIQRHFEKAEASQLETVVLVKLLAIVPLLYCNTFQFNKDTFSLDQMLVLRGSSSEVSKTSRDVLSSLNERSQSKTQCYFLVSKPSLCIHLFSH